MCKWINGQNKITPKITGYYLENDANRQRLTETYRNDFLPLVFDAGAMMQELHDLLVQDSSISEMQRKKLDATYPCLSEPEQAAYVIGLLLFCMERNFVKRDSQSKELLAINSMSPVIADYIYENDVPKPCRFFCGRDNELSVLHDRLAADKRVFLHSIAGIGKSELEKAYAKQYHKEYTNILYLTYSGNLMRDITEMGFSDYLPEDSQDERFRKHNRFLRSL